MFMDIDFDDQPSDLATTAAKAGAKFKPNPRPRLRKQASISTSPTLFTDANDKLSNALISETRVLDNDTINQSTHHGTLSGENVDVLSGGVHCCMEPTNLLARIGMDSEKKRCDDKDTPAFLDDGILQPEESFKIVQEGSSAYGQHTEKFQPKTRPHGNVIEEQNHGVNEEACEPHHYTEDIGDFSTGTSDPEFTVNGEESRDEAINMNANFFADLHEEVFPQALQETVPEMAAGNSSRGWEHEERVESPSCNNTVAGEDGCFAEEQSGRKKNVRKSKRAAAEKSRAAQKRKKTNDEPNQCCKKPRKKKFKHSTPRQKRTLGKELLEIPVDEIRFLPIKDLLRLVDYKEWLKKKEAKGREGSQTHESTSKASDKHYFQDDAENFDSDEYIESQETSRIKPDSPVNYQTFMHKTARSRWSKQDTGLFYEGICEFGSNLSMVQQLFPNRSRQQMKLKYKLEERKHPLKLNDALSSRSKHRTHYQNVIKKLQQEAGAREAEAKEEDDEDETAGEGATEAEAETNDVPEKEETERAGDAELGGKESDGAEAENNQRSNGGDGDDYWVSYTSDI